MINRCICYVTDKGYLFPTLISAMQAREHSSKATADIVIIAIGLDGKSTDLFRRVCDLESIQLLPFSNSSIEFAPSAMGRLFLGDLLPTQYSQLLYIDGDTQIAGSLDPLLGFSVPPGKFLAADDPLMFAAETGSRVDSEHLRSVYGDQGPAHRYFNSGVVRTDRRTWESIGRQAMTLYRTDQGRAWRWPDQDTLNIVGGSSRIPLSLVWNFPIYLRDTGLDRTIKPLIYHFMASPKPWQGSFRPWNAKFFMPYREAIRRYPELSDYRSTLPPVRHLRYRIQQRVKQVGTILLWKYSSRQRLILNYEQNSHAGAPARRDQASSWPVNPAPLQPLTVHSESD